MSEPTPLRDRIEQALCDRLREQMDPSAPGAQFRAEAKADDLTDAVLPVVESALADQRTRLRAVPDEHRCESVHPDGRLRCTRASDHVAHVNGGDAWSCACDLNTETLQQVEAKLQRLRDDLPNLERATRGIAATDSVAAIDELFACLRSVLDEPETT